MSSRFRYKKTMYRFTSDFKLLILDTYIHNKLSKHVMLYDIYII